MKKRAGFLASVALMLMLSIVLSACSAGQGQASLTGNDIVQKVREALKSNQSASGTIELSANINKSGLKSLLSSLMPNAPKGDMGTKAGSHIDMLPDTASVTLKVWEQSPDKARVEIASSSLPGMKGVTMVYDGSKAYAYLPSKNTVYTKTPGDNGAIQGKMASMLGDWATLTPEQRGDKLIAASDIKLLGSEQVGGKDTYKLEITPKQGALEQLGLNPMIQMMAGSIVNSLKATVWVDKASFVPVKATLAHPQMGEFTYTSTLDLNKAIDPAQFVLQTPAGAKTVDLDALHEQMQPKSMTLPQARDEVAKSNWKLLEPSYLPTNTTLVEVTRLAGAGTVTGNATWLPYLPPGAAGVTSSDTKAGPYSEISISTHIIGGAGIISNDVPMGGLTGINETGTVSVLTGQTSYVFKYSSPANDFIITESKSQIEKGLGDGYSGIAGNSTEMKEVTIRGVKAMAFSPDGSGWISLMWTDKSGVFVSIAGKLSLAEVQKIAEGLK